jgi:AmmeMemoRadiSam system protein B
MGARTSFDSAPLRRIVHILVAGSAFALSAFTSIAPSGGDVGRSPDFRDTAGSGREIAAVPRPFYLRYQYSSFTEDTALYAGAYRNAEGLRGGEREAGAVGGSAPAVESRSRRIIAGTISHHLFARDLIARYFIKLARSVHPKTIVIIGPNHHARGHSAIAISALRWRTPFGFVEPDSETIRRISNTGLACVEEEAFVNEHSIGALVPFIRRSFPGSRMVPIIFKKAANRQDCVGLAGALSNLMDSTLVLASLDWSHYKTSREADKEDVASLDVLCSLSKERVDETFVDSRPALLTLISLCRDIGVNTVEVVQHTNSGILSHNPHVPCTSYINTYIRN